MLKTLGELNLALDKREEGVVLTTANVLTRVDVGAFWRTRTSPAFTV